MLQAQMKLESNAIAELELRFTTEDAELFRLFAERTLPELSSNAADATDDARSAHFTIITLHLYMLLIIATWRSYDVMYLHVIV
jgi:hypothetical protein